MDLEVGAALLIPNQIRKLTKLRVVINHSKRFPILLHTAIGRRGRSDPDADVGRAGRGYVLGYRAHVACCAHRDLPVALTVQPCSRNDELFYKPLLQEARNLSAGVRWVAADRQYDSEELRRWTRDALGASTAIPTYRRRTGRA